ncbi:DHA2 family efflux MFS transporter permease subunit [Alicyclobacillus ferrooxydans]|nr:DHA2 family efflux MFS transporter permease subunit [Alicyclobacillus ferrooxydans]
MTDENGKQLGDAHMYEMYRMKAPYVQVAIIVLGVFMAVLDMGVVNVAIPTMESDLHATTNQIQWVLTAYMLVIGVLVPISGWMADRFGAKKLFLFSLFMFTLGSALCGMAWNVGSIIGFRVVQALGGGFMMPVAMAMIYRIFPPDRRGLVMGVFGVAIMAAPAFGPALSGYLVEYSSWRLIFYINVPIGIIALLLGATMMHEFSHEVKNKLDIWGFMLSTVGFFSLLYGFNNVPDHGWHSLLVTGFVALGVICLILLVIVELTTKSPIIELRVLKNYMFSMSLVISSIINTALFVGIFLLPLYLQNILGLSAVRTGLFMTPAALASAVVMPISGRLFDRIGARPLALIGLLFVTVASFGFTSMTTDSGTGHIQWLYIIRSIGMGMTMMPIMTAGMNTVKREWVSQGTAMTNTVRQVASSLGTAILTSYFTTRMHFHQTVASWSVTPFSPSGAAVNHLQGALQGKGMAPGVAHQLALSMMSGLTSEQGFVAGLNDTFWASTILAGIAWILVWFYGSKTEREMRLSNRRQKEKPARKAAKEVSVKANRDVAIN